MATITTDDQLTEEIGKVAAGQQAGVPKVDPVLQTLDATTIQPAAIAFSAAEEVVEPVVKYAPEAEYATTEFESPV